MRKEGFVTYKSIRDANLKIRTERSQNKIKRKRAKFRAAKKKTLEQASQARTTKRNYQTLSKGQQKRFERKYKKLERTSKRLRYANAGGRIEFKDILKEGNWTNNFVSTNVRQFRVRGKNLLIQFIDGSVYMYFGVGNKFLGLLNVGSKGKWVWKQLIRKNVNYIRIR